MFASRNFIVLALIFKAIIFFLLIFVYDLRQEPNLFFGHFDHIIVPAPFVEKIILFSCENQVTIYIWGLSDAAVVKNLPANAGTHSSVLA